MDDNIAIVHNHPAVAGKTLLLSLFMVFDAHIIDGGVGERVEHPVAGAAANNKIVGKRDNPFQVNQDNIFTLFVFKGVYNFTGKFKCVQVSPHGLGNGAENNFV
jgi:hypothetical protein